MTKLSLSNQEFNDKLQDLTRSISERMRTIATVDEREPIIILTAHARVLALYMAQMAPSEEEYITQMTDMFAVLTREGIDLRQRCKN